VIYQVDLSLPAQTTQAAPKTTAITVPYGRVARVGLLFPSGCAGLAHVQIYSNTFQVWPTTPGRSFAGDGHLISFEEAYQLTSAWNQLVISGWNDDDSYQHTVSVWIDVLPIDQGWVFGGLTGLPRYVE